MNPAVNEWLRLSEDCPKGISGFLCTLISFETYLNKFRECVKCDTVGTLKKRFIESQKSRKIYTKLLNNPEFKEKLAKYRESINQGESNYYVKDMRPDKKNVKEKFNDVKNFKQFIETIYQLRCNLIHGKKLPFDEKKLNAGYEVFYMFFNELINS